MKLAVSSLLAASTQADLERKKQSLQTVLRPDTRLDGRSGQWHTVCRVKLGILYL